MYMQDPISRPAKDFNAEIELDLPRKHVSMSNSSHGEDPYLNTVRRMRALM